MFWIDIRSQTPIYEQIKQRVIELISLEILHPGDSLPSVRSLARELGINPNTVQKAYQELESENIACSITGRGSFISAEPNMRNLLKDRKLLAVEKALLDGKKFGVTRPEINRVVETVYREGDI